MTVYGGSGAEDGGHISLAAGTGTNAGGNVYIRPGGGETSSGLVAVEDEFSTAQLLVSSRGVHVPRSIQLGISKPVLTPMASRSVMVVSGVDAQSVVYVVDAAVSSTLDIVFDDVVDGTIIMVLNDQSTALTVSSSVMYNGASTIIATKSLQSFMVYGCAAACKLVVKA
ncbi:MAG: hypothetical protein EOO65_05790 [Methanosarcinales archaeon]|nr:MAG: hypothetical protein EOO65_05790 [Methanosarcinales archaeon]